MPTEYDDFSGKAVRNHPAWNATAKDNLNILEDLMVSQGFTAYEGEWWHYVDQHTYPVIEEVEANINIKKAQK